MAVQLGQVVDPIQFQRLLWPHVHFYDKQREIIYSVVENDETVVHAGNMLGKDFVAAFIALWFFLTRHPCRVVTTSVDGLQLEGVLWGEIRRFLQTSVSPLSSEQGGPLVVNHLQLKKIVQGQVDGISYLIGRVAARGEGMLGHHVADIGDKIPKTLYCADEASGVEDLSKERADTWANRKLVIGNPYPCENFFRKAVRDGNIAAPDGHLYRRVIRVRAEDSPNVRLAFAQRTAGQEPTGEVLLPGILPWSEYEKRRQTWDEVRQCIGLDGEFYEGAEVLLYPPQWLNRAEEFARSSAFNSRDRQVKSVGVDPGEGGAETVWCGVDELGLIPEAFIAKKTPDTSVMVGDTIAYLKYHGISPKQIYFDRGGGGKQIADQLRLQGYDVQTVAFGEPITAEPRRGITGLGEIKDLRERKYTYKNRRAEMFGLLRELLDPSRGSEGFGIPASFTELRRQLSLMPLLFDSEGRMRMLPKSKKTEKSQEKTLIELLGCSPDQADALVLAVYGMTHRVPKTKAGAAW